MTATERETAVTRLYMSLGVAKLIMEAQMDALIKEGLTKETSAPLLDICEITLSLLRDS